MRIAVLLFSLVFAGGLTAPVAAQAQEGVGFPQDDPWFFLTIPDGWLLDNTDEEAWDLRPQVALKKGTPALADHVIVKLGVLATEEEAAELTWADLRAGLTDLIGDTVDDLEFDEPELIKGSPFVYGHLAASGNYSLTPGKGKPLYADLYVFRPEGAQVTRLKDLLPMGNGRLYSLVFFTRDESEKKWSQDMDELFDSIDLTAPAQ